MPIAREAAPWSARRAAGALALAAVLLAACAGVRLSEADRAGLDEQPAIHVLHYETALPVVKASGKAAAPAAAEVRRAAGADPAALVAQSFARLIGRKEKLKNLRIESRHLPRPVAASAKAHQARFRRGLALELWVEDWAFEPVAGSPGRHGMRLDARARLARIDDGRVLWSNGHCRIGGGNARDTRLTTAELTQGAKLRKVLAAARDECTRQLTRDFYETPGKK